jgi:nitroreductase
MRKAQTTAELHPIILERWSTRAFDASYEISEQELVTILEAARWAASANNMQPWRFAVATRGDELFAKFSESLAGFNKSWAPNASALIAVMFEKTNEKGEVRASAPFDTGLAVGQLVLQAQAIELHTHQIGGFDKEALLVALGSPENLQPVVLIAVGKYASDTDLPEEILKRESANRERKELSEIVIAGL